MERTTLQAQVEGAATRIKEKDEDIDKHMDKGMTNPESNVIIVKSMGIMQMNVEINKMT